MLAYYDRACAEAAAAVVVVAAAAVDCLGQYSRIRSECSLNYAGDLWAVVKAAAAAVVAAAVGD